MAKAKVKNKSDNLHKSPPFLLIVVFAFIFLSIINARPLFGIGNKVLADNNSEKNLIRSWDFKKLSFATYPFNVKKENPPTISAKSAIIIDPDSRVVLFSKDPNQKLPPASLVKLATALVALGNCPLNRVIPINQTNVTGTKAGLQVGDKISIEGLLYALLLPSGNDAAQVLSFNCRSENEQFVDSMNSLSRLLSMNNTRFTNVSGLDSKDQYSTAYDLSLLAKAVVDNNQLAAIVATKEIDFGNAENTRDYHFVNLNRLLSKKQGVLGIKTGTTEAAGENLITLVNRDNQRIIVVVLGSLDRFNDSNILIDWAYSNYDWIKF